MKDSINPAVAAVVVIVLVVIAVFFIVKGTGPRTDGPSEPIDMGKAMGGANKAAPPPGAGQSHGPGQPRPAGGANGR
jgi:hypothetical protein